MDNCHFSARVHGWFRALSQFSFEVLPQDSDDGIDNVQDPQPAAYDGAALLADRAVHHVTAAAETAHSGDGSGCLPVADSVRTSGPGVANDRHVTEQDVLFESSDSEESEEIESDSESDERDGLDKYEPEIDVDDDDDDDDSIDDDSGHRVAQKLKRACPQAGSRKRARILEVGHIATALCFKCNCGHDCMQAVVKMLRQSGKNPGLEMLNARQARLKVAQATFAYEQLEQFKTIDDNMDVTFECKVESKRVCEETWRVWLAMPKRTVSRYKKYVRQKRKDSSKGTRPRGHKSELVVRFLMNEFYGNFGHPDPVTGIVHVPAMNLREVVWPEYVQYLKDQYHGDWKANAVTLKTFYKINHRHFAKQDAETLQVAFRSKPGTK